MASFPQVIEVLIEKLVKLPGIGRRSAERIVFYILNSPKEEIRTLINAVINVKERVGVCKICQSLSEQDLCSVCADVKREKGVLCVVEDTSSVAAIEKAGNFNGVYHVLQGSISPLEDKGPDDIRIKELILRIKQNSVKEIILATDSDTEGETTALFLARLIKPLGVKLSRIGLGIPMGSNLEYFDSATISKALESRREI